MNEFVGIDSHLQGKRSGARLYALDAARGLAVIGMYIQHFASNSWNGFVSGNTMILFMLCSGISYAIMAERMGEKCGQKGLRTRILARSVFIDFVGYLLIMLNGPFAVVLPAYAMLYLCTLPLLQKKEKTLFALSGIMYLISPPLMVIGLSLLKPAILADIAGGPISALAWAPVFLLGMAIGHLNLKDGKVAGKMIIAGILILIPVKLLELYVMPQLLQIYTNWTMAHGASASIQPDTFAMWPFNADPVMWQMLFVSTPQGGSFCELMAGTGGSLILLGFLCLTGIKSEKVLTPFCNIGKLALSLYTLQIILGWAFTLAGADGIMMNIGAVPLGDMLLAVVVILLALLMTKFHVKPLENLIRKFEGQF